MSNIPNIILITLAVIFIIIIFSVSDNSLFNKISKKFQELSKTLISLNDWTKHFQAQLQEIYNMLLAKSPLDLQILQMTMLYLAEDGLIEMPSMVFEKRPVNESNFKIIFATPHLQLVIKIIAKYIGRDVKNDFPEIAHSQKENPNTIIMKNGEILKEYFAVANKLLGN